MNNIKAIFLMVTLIYIWFDTDAFAEYVRFLRLKFFNYNDFFIERNTQLGQITSRTYPIFILNKYPNFFIKIITCPVCLMVWMNIIFAIVVGDWYIIGINTILTWVLYSGLVKFLRWSNE